MTSSMIPLHATAQRVTVLECAPSAIRSAMRQRGQQEWTIPLADFAVDVVTGALTMTAATEVLVPASLVHFVERQRTRAEPSPWPTWDTALRDRRLVTWASVTDALRLLECGYASSYTELCVPVPGGPLISQVDFGTPFDAFYGSTLPTLLDTVSARSGKVQWRAWMRSALSCPLEGTHVPPIRVCDHTSQLLGQDGGCTTVVWEDAVKGLTPRWLETATKTALAVGIAPSSLTLSLPEEASRTAQLLAKSVEVGVTSWTTNAMAGVSLFPRTAAIVTPQSVQLFTAGWNEVADVRNTSAGAREEESVSSLVQCADFVEAVQERYLTLFER